MLRRALLIGIPLLVLLLAVTGVVANHLLKRYLSGDSFRALVSEKTSEALHVSGTFSPLRWTGFSVYSDEFSGSARPGSHVEHLELLRVRTHFDWQAIFDGVWKLDDVAVGRARITLSEEPAPGRETMETTLPVKARQLPGWFPQRFAIDRISIEDFSLSHPRGSIAGARTILESHGAAWSVSSEGGRIHFHPLPDNRIRSLRARISGNTFFLTGLELLFDGGGTLQATGEIHPGTHSSDLHLEWERVDLATLLPERHVDRLSGIVSGKARAVNSPGESQTTGSFAVRDGTLQHLPVLELLARFTKSPQFERLPVQEMSADFRRTHDQLHLTNFVLESRGLLRVEGDFDVGEGGVLSGDLQVGLTPQTLRWIPGSREKVFTDSRDGYLWANLKLGGTIEHPSEDLSKRLALAMGEELLIKPAERVIDAAGETAVEGIKGVLDILLPTP